MKITAADLVKAINHLPKNNFYSYVNNATKSQILISEIILPEGPIKIKRFNPYKKQSPKTAKEVSISKQMIWRIANAISENHPINFDRILGASYNTRSALEALLAHTPHFYFCFPGRIETNRSSTKIKKGHKHLLWLPNKPHESGIMMEEKTDKVVSEIPSADAIYESLTLYDKHISENINIEVQRRHAQIQIALMLIGVQLGSKVWIAQNDKSIVYNGKKIGEYDGVIPSLNDVQMLNAYTEAINAAMLIDVIWFRNSRFMPGVFEIEHSTGVTSGLSRMKNFYDKFLRLQDTRYVIVAPDEIRDKVLKEANKEQFIDLHVNYFSYSAVEELYSLVQRRKIRGVTDEFLDCYMEQCVVN